MKLGAFGPPHAQEPAREAIRNRQLEEARRVGWPRLEREDLVPVRYGIVEHRQSGNFYAPCRGELTDSVYTGAIAFFEDDSGAIRFLEPPSGFPSNRAELEKRRAERERRRNAPRPRRQAAPR